MTDDPTASCDCRVPSLQEFRVACHTRSPKISFQEYACSMWYQEKTEQYLVRSQVPTPPVQGLC